MQFNKAHYAGEWPNLRVESSVRRAQAANGAELDLAGIHSKERQEPDGEARISSEELPWTGQSGPRTTIADC